MHMLHARLWIRIHFATDIALFVRPRVLFAFDLCLKVYHGLDVQLAHIITDTCRLRSRLAHVLVCSCRLSEHFVF